ncbi:threonine-phosphate decarboxylase [Mesorhizobium sp. M2D.F.Ca.ET.185.01.1.1]|uniref:threonine-phosphate decarboxylase CobD n=2 Tax=Mesorhizobium TaxID=68287 RepID=UPI000FCBAF72|nr:MULTISPECIES: threonine-phosphate decarboxylase CobD [unclassified Mesorhizobium]TGP79420.1 threonine-phosphate decarboxylase [bacterium M00.F.Ca.ET.227.01.1.1]TGQ00842.1 threonine-phosphate decarboxylase [bacterium M00.F.Ca.ET.221.01.1.1]TGQ02637.1 threonine-phosphate decarboxylase [bacterium M00.F.Ca.ET.222.01.1.1]TGU12530.1 threonine-phosphate decarboxylase [bacterium M00.F.Ca.ET.163.01.1.1]TGU34504.1 threonine-phosphate decarboxylase [bacterium M00.F.Ca.ET.156.01.1.1]TGU46467.1 threoni
MKLLSGAIAAVDHGGSLGRASALFPHAPKPFVDLSTGINPHSYPLFELPATALSRLPEAAQLRELAEIAASAYGVPSAAHVAAAPGTQILLPRVASLLRPGRALVLGPTYAEHARAAAIAGHAVAEVSDFDALVEADLAVLVNPNNPDGRVIEKARLLELAARLRAKGGLLVVDEAFMDVGPIEHSLAGDVTEGGIVVLRSFGKFFGLAGVRLGFALTDALTAERLDAQLGPWAVAGPALEYGIRALSDTKWQADMRQRLALDVGRLDALLGRSDVPVAGGTSLFRYLSFPAAPTLFSALGERGVLVRHFAERPQVLRIGLPGSEAEWQRLESALAAWVARREDAPKEIGQ